MKKSKKKGNFPINSKQISTIESFVEKALQQLANAPSLDASDRQQALKLRDGAQQVIPTVASLVSKYELQTTRVRVDDASSIVAYAATLRALVGPTTLLLKRIKDEILRSENDAWRSTTVSYGMLQSFATGVPELATELATVEQWFRRGHLRAKAARAAAARAGATVTAGKPAVSVVEPAVPAATENPAPKA